MFELHPQLAQDSWRLLALELCDLLLSKDANYPWLILVPRRVGLLELCELTEAEQQQFMRESSLVARVLLAALQPKKLNIAALGNLVPQLHIHHIARFSTDPAWPAPVWGKVPAQPYQTQQLQQLLTVLAQHWPNNSGSVFWPAAATLLNPANS